ncbi:MAG: LacI family DNA-binding transcriptional regulator [Chloroflexota bacterium]|nr:LacI family DNA-binding transcriptional regulator [Chloroflexota bacterium]
MQKPIRSSSKSVTIKDVAREAGVSITTVSNVLNGRTGAMSAKTLARVNAVIGTHGYRPSSAARSLVTGRAATIAVVLAGRGCSRLFPAVATIQELAAEAGYGLALLIAKDADARGKTMGILGERQVAGVVFVSSSGDALDDGLRPLLESSIPMVLLNGNVDVQDAVQVAWDDAGGVAGAVAHLIELGHRRIAYLGDPSEPQSTEARRQGYLGAMADHGLRPRDEWLKACGLDAPRDRWRKTLTELVSAPPRPTAAVAANDAIAAVAMRELQRMGVRVPGDFAMIGVGGSEYCPLLSPALTTVRLPVEEAGRCAAEMLLEMMAGGQSGGQRVVLPCPLIVRESCGAGARANTTPSDQAVLQRPLW